MLMRFAGAAVLLAALFAVGCAKTPPEFVGVEGQVLLDGKPLPNADVQFVPMVKGFGAEVIAMGTTDENGKFKLTSGGRDGAAVGENHVTVSEASLPEKFRSQSGEAQMAASKYLASLKNRPIPNRYANLAQSPLRVEVKPDQKEYKLELSR